MCVYFLYGCVYWQHVVWEPSFELMHYDATDGLWCQIWVPMVKISEWKHTWRHNQKQMTQRKLQKNARRVTKLSTWEYEKIRVVRLWCPSIISKKFIFFARDRSYISITNNGNIGNPLKRGKFHLPSVEEKDY